MTKYINTFLLWVRMCILQMLALTPNVIKYLKLNLK